MSYNPSPRPTMLARMLNVAKAALNPSQRSVIFKKVVKRLTDRPDPAALEENKDWILANSRDFAAEAEATNPVLWREATAAAAVLKLRAKDKFDEIGFRMGGGGFYPMLYFLVRRKRPTVVVETGVAAGFSSQTLLAALDANGDGMLFSSDFPYFRLDNPEQYIGILVEERLKSRWRLFIRGDETNLPEILTEVNHIDLFHYDSDKTHSGRELAVALVLPKMRRGSIFVMDDIQDGPYFKDLVAKLRPMNFATYEFEGKYIGMLEVP